MSVVSIHGSVVPAACTTAVPSKTVVVPVTLPLISASGARAEAIDNDDDVEENSDVADDDSDDNDLDDGFGDDKENDGEDGFKDGLDDDDELDEFDDIDEDDFDDDFDDDFEEELKDDYEITIDDEVSAGAGLSGEGAGDEKVDDGLDDFDDFDKVE